MKVRTDTECEYCTHNKNSIESLLHAIEIEKSDIISVESELKSKGG